MGEKEAESVVIEAGQARLEDGSLVTEAGRARPGKERQDGQSHDAEARPRVLLQGVKAGLAQGAEVLQGRGPPHRGCEGVPEGTQRC